MQRIIPLQRRGGAMIQVIVAAAVVALLLAWLIPVTRVARDRASFAGCRENLRRLGVALSQYAAENHGQFPVSPTLQNPHVFLVDSLTARYHADPRDFYCPAERNPDLIFTPDHVRSGTIDYYYYSALSNANDLTLGKLLRNDVHWPRELNATMDPRTWLLSDIWNSGQPTTHQGYRKGLNYLMIDGSVAFVSESPRKAFH